VVVVVVVVVVEKVVVVVEKVVVVVVVVVVVEKVPRAFLSVLCCICFDVQYEYDLHATLTHCCSMVVSCFLTGRGGAGQSRRAIDLRSGV